MTVYVGGVVMGRGFMSGRKLLLQLEEDMGGTEFEVADKVLQSVQATSW